MSQQYDLARLLVGRLPSADETEAHRRRRLRELIAHAYAHVPYYRRLFDGAGLVPGDIREPADLAHVPVSNRDELRAAGTDLLSTNRDRSRLHVGHTSGSTGKPWAVYRSQTDDLLRRAAEFRTMRRAGVGPRDVVATLGPLRAWPRRLVQRLGLYRTHMISPLLPVPRQLERLREIRPTVFWVYPTALRALVNECGSLDGVVRLRMMINSAEPMDDVLRQRAGAAARERRNFYGSVEIGRMAWECEAHEGLHLNADCVILELVEESVPGAGRSVVVTNLNSHAMPYIRYRLGDRCELIKRPCSCGVPQPLMTAPVGREWDVIRRPDGGMLSPWGFNAYLRGLPDLRQFRVIQERTDRITVQLCFARPPAGGAIEILRAQLTAHLGPGMSTHIEIVERMDNGASKFRNFISKLQS